MGIGDMATAPDGGTGAVACLDPDSPIEAAARRHVPSIDIARDVAALWPVRGSLLRPGGGRSRQPNPGAVRLDTLEYAPPVRSEHGLDSTTAAALETQLPGPDLAATLSGLELADADDATVVEAIAAWERLASWAVAQQARATAELSERRGSSSAGLAAAASEIGTRLAITGRAAEVKLGLGVALSSYPEVADALGTGQIDARKADVLVTTEPGLTSREQRRVQREVLPHAHELTAPQLRERLRKAALTTDPEAGAKRRAKAFSERRVCVDPAGDAMSWVSALVRSDHAEMTRTVLDALAAAAKSDGDGRTVDQRRADAFTDIFAALLDNGTDLLGHDLPTRHRRHPHIQVTVGAGTLLGLDDQPAVLGGYGPIPAELAREIAQDGTWRGLFTDVAGAVAAVGTKKYVPGADLTRQVIARDATCTFPGCRQPAGSTDLDHIVAYDPAVADAIEQTTISRLHALCRRHHNLKTAKFWRVTRNERGAVVWTAPTGHQYVRPAERPPASGTPPARGPTSPAGGFTPPARGSTSPAGGTAGSTARPEPDALGHPPF